MRYRKDRDTENRVMDIEMIEKRMMEDEDGRRP